MRRTSVLAAFLVIGAVACHRDYRPGTTSLTSISISEEPVAPAPAVFPEPRISATWGADAGATESTSTPVEENAVPRSAETPPRAPLVTPGLDNTVTGGVANTGAPLNYGIGNNGNVGER